jgi:hypothetical protein
MDQSGSLLARQDLDREQIKVSPATVGWEGWGQRKSAKALRQKILTALEKQQHSWWRKRRRVERTT